MLDVGLLTALLLTAMGWLVTSQARRLVAQLPSYSANIQERLASLRRLGEKFKLGKMIEEWDGVSDPQAGQKQSEEVQPAAVVVKPPASLDWLARLPDYLASAAKAMGSLALAIILVAFMLLNREELRNRFIRLVGIHRLSYTTKAVDEVSRRISSFLIMQAIVNGSFGCALALGLYLIGIPYAALWGLLAGLLRFVPYIGIWIAALFAITLSLAAFSGWWQLLATLAVFLILELITNNVMGPWLYGRSMGISKVAVLISAAFWVFLWGPVGLILSTPLTGALLVLGKYVPQLGFLDLLLGEGQTLDADVSYYQRLLARDQDEATDLVFDWINPSAPEKVYDAVLVPALSYAVRDRERGELTEEDEKFIVPAIREILEDLGERFPAPGPPDPEGQLKLTGDSRKPIPILGCPARGEQDCLALEMLRQVLDPTRWTMKITPVELLTAEIVARANAEASALVCIGSLPPGGMAHKMLAAGHYAASQCWLWSLLPETGKISRCESLT